MTLLPEQTLQNWVSLSGRRLVRVDSVTRAYGTENRRQSPKQHRRRSLNHVI